MTYNKYLFFICSLILIAGRAGADLTLNQSMTVEAGGAMSFFSSDGTVTTMISGDKSRSEVQVQPRSGMMAAFAKNTDNVSIMRLDKDRIWQLMPDRQQYSEMTFEELRQQIAASQAQMQQMQQGGSAQLPVSENECQWSDSSLDIQATGEKERFANVKAERHVIRVSETCTVPEKNQTCILNWTLDHWLAARMPGNEEAEAFHKRMAEKMGVDDMMNRLGMSGGLLAMFREGWQEAIAEADNLEGFPVKTVMTMEIGGPNCTTGSGQPIATDGMWASAMDAGMDAAASAAARQAGEKVAQETVGNTIGNAAIGGAAQDMIGGMLKGFGKRKNKKKQQQAEAAAQAAATPTADSVVLFKVTNELTAISTDPVAAAQFEVPAGWEKIAGAH